MITTPFETRLFGDLSLFFAQRHYVLLPDRKQFRRTLPNGFLNVLLSVTPYPDETWIEVLFGCRNEQVEQIAQQFLHTLPGFRTEANTLIMNLGRFSGWPYFRFKIRTEEDQQAVVGHITTFFQDVGFDFLESLQTMNVVDELLNQPADPPNPYVFNQTHRCYKGLIAAKLVHSPQYDQLVSDYRQLLIQQSQNPHEQHNYERLVAFLNHYSAN